MRHELEGKPIHVAGNHRIVRVRRLVASLEGVEPGLHIIQQAASGADPEEQIKRMASSAPMGRLGDPAEFGAACAFLCSKQAGYITGQTLGVDGGALLGVH